MRFYEAEKVLRILVQCNEACEECAAPLVRQFLVDWPQYRALARMVWRETFYLAEYEEVPPWLR